jgi:hypothetical protein
MNPRRLTSPTTPSEPSDVIPTDGGTITPQTSDPTSSAAAVLVALAGSAIAIGMIGPSSRGLGHRRAEDYNRMAVMRGPRAAHPFGEA